MLLYTQSRYYMCLTRLQNPEQLITFSLQVFRRRLGFAFLVRVFVTVLNVSFFFLFVL